MFPPVPEPISSTLGKIVGRASSQMVPFVRSTWVSWLESAGWDEEHIGQVMGRIPSNEISRDQIRACSRQVANAEADFADLLVLTLIWGRGKSNGRMKPHIITLLAHNGLENALEKISYATRLDGAAGGHRAWTLPGLREPFFTKFLWAVTSHRHSSERCLVLDGNVRRSLKTLGVEWPAAGRHEKYEWYVNLVRSWCDDTHDPEDLEWLLFRMNGDLSKLECS
jgi:hypothetical protein